MLGHDVVAALRGRPVLSFGREELDVTDLDRLKAVVKAGDVIVNCAGYTRVDDAETDEDEATQVNGVAVGNLARAAREADGTLVTISTDYVFDGSAETPYAETQQQHPISAYGRSKAAGELAAMREHPDGSYIVRTAWTYGAHGKNFAQTMLDLARSKDNWDVVNDQRGQPTWTADLAEQIVRLLDSDAPAGIYHGTNSGETSWFGFAQAVLEEAGLEPSRITPTDSAHFVRPAPRPSYSVLGHDRWAAVGLPAMRSWREALHAAFEAGTFDI